MTVPPIASCAGRAAAPPTPERGGQDKQGLSCNCLPVSATWWRFSVMILMCVLRQELEKPSPPQKPLPADPRSSRLVRSPSVAQRASAVCGPAPIPGVLRPVRPVPHPNRWVPTLIRLQTALTHWEIIFFTYLHTLSPSSRPSPKHPPTLPKPCIIANVKYSSWDFGRKGHCCDKTLKNLHYENSENLKKMVASLSFESGDPPCPFGALSLNGATSLSSGTCKVFIFCIYYHAVHCARHFYHTVATF